VNPDVLKLKRRWRNEKFAPELLPSDHEVVETISETIDFVRENMEDECTKSNPRECNDPNIVLRLRDLQRSKYLLADYLRIRLWKLRQWPQHYLEPANMALLSPPERSYLRESWELKENFFNHRLLVALPEAKQSLDDKLDLLDMVRRPDLDSHVYVRILDDVGEIDVSPTFTQETSPSAGEPLRLDVNNTYLLKYSLVRKFLIEKVHDGKVELV